LPTPADPAGSGPEIQAPARKRRGFPVFPTLMVAVALPILIGFGVWQLQRMAWKEALLADLARNSAAPLIDLGAGPIPADAQFRLVRLQLACAGGPATLKAGRNLAGQSGYAAHGECLAGRTPVARDLGWQARPEALQLEPVTATFEGRLVKGEGEGWILVQSSAQPPLVPSAPPGLETISNNHLSYAVQWFSFATILAVIYGLWLRRWLATNRPRA
jgi:cytochrome oxidase assembly protein ShyY1